MVSVRRASSSPAPGRTPARAARRDRRAPPRRATPPPPDAWREASRRGRCSSWRRRRGSRAARPAGARSGAARASGSSRSGCSPSSSTSVVVATALLGLREVADANADVARIMTAQRALPGRRHGARRDPRERARVGGSSAGRCCRGWPTRPTRRPCSRATSRSSRSELERVDGVRLPRASSRGLATTCASEQDRYAAEAQDVAGGHGRPGPDRLGSTVQGFRATAVVLALRQEARHRRDERRGDAGCGSRAGRRATGAAPARWPRRVVALLGLLGITGLLHRMGGDLATLLARERGVAETLQHSLLPDRLPDLPGLRLAARYRPGAVGTQVGGDWYDVVPLPGGRVGLVMGDVVGHDLQRRLQHGAAAQRAARLRCRGRAARRGAASGSTGCASPRTSATWRRCSTRCSTPSRRRSRSPTPATTRPCW